jgi:hypothetical protein
MNGSLDHVFIHFRALTECLISRSIQVLRNTLLKSPLEQSSFSDEHRSYGSYPAAHPDIYLTAC